MPGASDQELALAQIYVGALLALAEKLGEVDVLARELRELADQINKQPDIEDFLSSPIVDLQTRKGAIEKLFRGRRSDLFVDTLQVLNRRGRLDLLPKIADVYHHERERVRGRVEVYVRSAVSLNDRLRERLREVAASQTGKEIDLIEMQEDAVIGGLIMQIGDRKLDASVATRLKRLSEALLQRASHEIHFGTDFVETETS